MSVALAMSSVMSTAAVVAILAPASVALARRTGHPTSKLLLPLAFGAALGCNILAISSVPTMLLTEWARQNLGVHVGILGLAPAGLVIAVAGMTAVVIFVLKRLPERGPDDALRRNVSPEAAASMHGLDRALYRMRLLPGSPACGKRLADSGLRDQGIDVLAVRQSGTLGGSVLEPLPERVLAAGDELFIECDDEAAFLLSERGTMQLGLAGRREIESLLGHGILLAEVTPAPRSGAIGRSVRELELRRRRGVNALSLWRQGEVIVAGVADLPLAPGDAFLVAGSRANVWALAEDPDWIVLTEHRHGEDVHRAPLAIALLLLAIVPPMLGVMPLPLSALGAAVLMVATRCLDLRQVTRALDMRVLLLTVGMLPLGLALERHGVAARLAEALATVGAPLGALGVLAAIFVAAMGLATLTTNATAAAVLAPMAGAIASRAGVPPMEAITAVAFGANSTFLSPFSSSSLIVMGPGGYRPRDILRAGALVTLVVVPVAVVAIRLLVR
jgi:di/tricarboxylate transporter